MTPSPEFLQQYEALTRGVGIAPLAGRTIIEVTGSDRVQILQSFTTNDVKRLQPGQGCEAFVTSPQGKTLGHVWIFCEKNRHILDTAPGEAQTLIDHFNRYVITEDVTLTDKSGEYVDLLVAGSEAAPMLAKLTTQNAPPNLLDHGTFQIAGHDITIRHVDYTDPHSYLLQLPKNNVDTITNALTNAGAIACDHDALESARLEAGFPLFGLDITPDNLPQEITRDAKAISFTKGCYLGQETVARIDAIGHVNRILAWVVLTDDKIPGRGTELFAAGQNVGEITSAAWSPQLQAPLALAIVRRNSAKPGNELETKHGHARVVPLPLAASA